MKKAVRNALAGIALGASMLGTPKVDAGIINLNFDDSDKVIQVGEQSSYTINVKTSDSILAPYKIFGMDYTVTHPTQFNVTGHTTFTSTGQDNTGTFLSNSFLNGNNVHSLTSVNNTGGDIGTGDSDELLPTGTEADGDAVRYFFSVLQPGVYNLDLNSGTIILALGSQPIPESMRSGDTLTVLPLPEPSTLGILGLGGLLAANRRKRKSLDDKLR